MLRIGTLVVMLITLVLFMAMGNKHESKLIISPNRIDLGDVPAGKTVTFDINLKNQGNSPVRVHGVKTSCGCTIVSERTFNIQPQNDKEIGVTVELPEVSREISGELTIYYGNPISSASINYRGLYVHSHVSCHRMHILQAQPFAA